MRRISDKVTAFSLYHTNASTALGPHESREESLQGCLRHSITEGQRRFAEIPLQLKRSFSNPLLWSKVIEDSWGALCKLHGSTASDYDAFVQAMRQMGDIGRLEQRWRKQGILERVKGTFKGLNTSGWKVGFYNLVIARFFNTRAARLCAYRPWRTRPPTPIGYGEVDLWSPPLGTHRAGISAARR